MESPLTINAADVQKCLTTNVLVITGSPLLKPALKQAIWMLYSAMPQPLCGSRSPILGSGLTYTVEDVRLTGADAQWYALKTTYNDGEITKAPVD